MEYSYWLSDCFKRMEVEQDKQEDVEESINRFVNDNIWLQTVYNISVKLGYYPSESETQFPESNCGYTVSYELPTKENFYIVIGERVPEWFVDFFRWAPGIFCIAQSHYEYFIKNGNIDYYFMSDPSAVLSDLVKNHDLECRPDLKESEKTQGYIKIIDFFIRNGISIKPKYDDINENNSPRTIDNWVSEVRSAMRRAGWKP